MSEPSVEADAMADPRFRGLILQIQVEDAAEGPAFYSRAFTRGPDFAPREDFFESHVMDGAEVWWQIVPSTPSPLDTRTGLWGAGRAVRGAVAAQEMGTPVTGVSRLSGVVSLVECEDARDCQSGE